MVCLGYWNNCSILQNLFVLISFQQLDNIAAGITEHSKHSQLLQDHYTKIKVVFLPPNITRNIQSMSQSVALIKNNQPGYLGNQQDTWNYPEGILESLQHLECSQQH